MTLSRVTRTCAARALGDLLAAAGLSHDSLETVRNDRAFGDAVSEQVKFASPAGTEAADPDGALLVLAASYAVGRMTYVTQCVAEDIEKAWDTLGVKHRADIRAIIQERAERGHLGMAVDVALWERVMSLPLQAEASAPSL